MNSATQPTTMLSIILVICPFVTTLKAEFSGKKRSTFLKTLRNCLFSILEDYSMSPDEISRQKGWKLGNRCSKFLLFLNGWWLMCGPNLHACKLVLVS